MKKVLSVILSVCLMFGVFACFATAAAIPTIDTEIPVKVKCGETGKIFGSVTAQEISDGLKKLGYDIDKKKILLKEPIKKLGIYRLDVKLLPNITTKIVVKVESI